MKYVIVFLFGSCAAICLGTGAYMAYLDKANWGWLIVAGIIILDGAFNYREGGPPEEENKPDNDIGIE